MMSPAFRRGSQWGQLTHASVVSSTRDARSRTHAHGAFSASNQNGARRNSVGTADRHVAAPRPAFIVAFTDALAKGMTGITGPRPDSYPNDVPVERGSRHHRDGRNIVSSRLASRSAWFDGRHSRASVCSGARMSRLGGEPMSRQLENPRDGSLLHLSLLNRAPCVNHEQVCRASVVASQLDDLPDPVHGQTRSI